MIQPFHFRIPKTLTRLLIRSEKGLILYIMKIIFLLLFASVITACTVAERFINVLSGKVETVRVVTATIEPGLIESPLPGASTTWTPESWTPAPSPTSTLTATPEFVCPNAPKSQLNVGDIARVTDSKGPALRLRRDPVVANNNILKLLRKGTKFEIIAGPECVPVPDTGTSYIFWQIQIPGDPLKGWVAEGDANNYFIEPVPK